AVHRAGLVHGDINGTNVMREDDGRVVLMDFGASEASQAQITRVTGTPLYMAPEIFDGQPHSVRSDIYAVGVLLYHLLSGSYPVSGARLGDVRGAHRRGER